MQPDAGGGRWIKRRKQPLLGARVCPSGDNCRGTQHRNCRGNLTQVVAGGSSAESNLFWALVYVPQGTTAGALNIATAGATPGSMYEPNQFVMNCGVIDPTAGPIRIYSPISRNLNDGDKISLLIRPTLDGAATIVSLCALCYHSN